MRPALAVAALIGACALGMAAEWMILRPRPAKPEPPAPAVRQQDGSLVLERKPDPAARPAQQIPAGARVERIVSVTVVPSLSIAETVPTPGIAPQDAGSLRPATSTRSTPCPPVRVDLTLVRMQDQTRRVVASSPDGRVVGGMDVPVDEPAQPRELKWQLSGLAGWDIRERRRVFGALLSRQVGPFSIQSGWIGHTAFVGAGVRW